MEFRMSSAFRKRMLERIVRLSVAILLLSMALPACSMLTTRGRQERAYERYVQKSSHRRDRQRAKMKTSRMPALPPSQDKVTTEAGNSPEPVTSGEVQDAPEQNP
jgi:hypothetical protein